MAYENLNPEKGLIWRIAHRDNVEWVLANGLCSANSGIQDPNFTAIGNPDLIDRRQTRSIPLPPGGTLSDYVPFYFTPFSPMMANIFSGRGGVTQRARDEICIIVSSLPKMLELGMGFVFSDRHAYLNSANFYNNISDLHNIDWPRLQARDFKRDPDDPEKFEKYQAEALIHQHVPVDALLGVICYSDTIKNGITDLIEKQTVQLTAHSMPGWYL